VKKEIVLPITRIHNFHASFLNMNRSGGKSVLWNHFH